MVGTVQLSVAVGGVQVAVAEQVPVVADKVILDGVPVMVGPCVSLMVTVNEQVETLPAASVAV